MPFHRFRGGDSFGFLGVLLQTGANHNNYLHTFRINIRHELLRRFVCSCGRQMSYIIFDPLQSVWWPCWSSFAQRRVWHRAGKGCMKGGKSPKKIDCPQVWKNSPKFFFFSSSAAVVLRKKFSSTMHAVWLCIGLHAKDWLWEIEASEFPCGYLCNLARQKIVLSKLAGVVWNKKGESRFSRPELEKWW